MKGANILNTFTCPATMFMLASRVVDVYHLVILDRRSGSVV